MNAAAIFAILEKGLTLIPILLQAGQDIAPILTRMTQITQGGAAGTVTQAELDSLEADLDKALADFNAPMV